ncbi:MAG: hypothetical protein HY787_15935 [Deltaproteobacteria bacterium]|nr:hypothetical protein [Deltaproteobacteria bacterium]
MGRRCYWSRPEVVCILNNLVNGMEFWIKVKKFYSYSDLREGDMKEIFTKKSGFIFILILLMSLTFSNGPRAFAQLPGGTVIPTDIPKYVIPLVIPPVMNDTKSKNRVQDKYEIAVRQFQQQILPGGIWNALNGRADAFAPTTVWSYGPSADPLPDASALGIAPGIAPAPNSQFNYPAYTIETQSKKRVNVRWINDLKENFGAGPNFLSHLLPIDQTLHWANPPQDCMHGNPRTDCMGMNPNPYTGPVPIVTHVHGAHVDPHSDGFPEAWWLPVLNAEDRALFATEGSLFDDFAGHPRGLNLGYADFSYRNDQPATTLWYHDHALGMTRSNVYAGPAGFWLVRGGEFDKADNVKTKFLKWDGILPGPAPERGDTVLELNAPGVMGAKDVRSRIREIPIVIQDRSFSNNGASLFYPDNRAFFEGLLPANLQIPLIPEEADPTANPQGVLSDISPIWNPEAFFNVMVVNGTSWPSLDVAPTLYRFRLLNGCNSRFLNLSLQIVSSPNPSLVGKELSFYQIGAEQGFLPKVVEVRTGFATPLPGNGSIQIRPIGFRPPIRNRPYSWLWPSGRMSWWTFGSCPPARSSA